jgi:biotin carboxyl carrier protein
MRYEAEIEGRSVSVELEQRNGRIVAIIDSRSYDVEVLNPEEGVYLIFAGNLVYEARVWSAESSSFNVKLRGQVFNAKVFDRKRARAVAEHSDEGQQHLTSPMPGKVVRVLLKPGDQVAAGQGVVIVEAMKMQNEIKSPRAGRLIEVRVVEGATVNATQVLAIVD